MATINETQSAIEALAEVHYTTNDALLRATLAVIIANKVTRRMSYNDFVAELRKHPNESRVYAMRNVGPARFEMLRRLFLDGEQAS